jgi:NADP-dependent 3-hydroxy acid dehydrogenase YdfG
MEIKNKVIIVTGVLSEIGEAAAKTLTAKGVKVALAARSEDKLAKLLKSPPDSFVVKTDMMDSEIISLAPQQDK